MRALSIAKFEEGIVNEDAAIANENVIAVSDGAGGGGVFAERWSQCLVNHLPDKPIKNYKAFDKWIDGIWEPFYNDCEKEAKKIGGLFLNKFYDEGSFATLVAVWKNGVWIRATVWLSAITKRLESFNIHSLDLQISTILHI